MEVWPMQAAREVEREPEYPREISLAQRKLAKEVAQPPSLQRRPVLPPSAGSYSKPALESDQAR